MALNSGTRLGPYEIQSTLGAGGMGEVYRARDTRLDRTVAIKVLRRALANDPTVRQRLIREARAVAALNDPRICTIHDIGQHDDTDYLVMEYVEGETLARRVARGPLPVAQVLTVAADIADALDRAHRTGITHRDLKPGNVMLTKAGVKLLDFGLAKVKPVDAAAGIGGAGMATVDEPITAQGTILGTLQYMAPEQLDGRDVDARSDIFAFGAVVYEMATGRKAFDGHSAPTVIAKILETDPPPIAALQPMAPPALDRVVRKCLRKDPEDRWQSARDVADELKWIGESASQPGESSTDRRQVGDRRRLRWFAATAVLVIAALALGAWLAYWRPAVSSGDAVRFTIGAPDKITFDPAPAFLSLSPDGTNLAFVGADASGTRRLWIRSLNSLDGRPLAGTEGATQAFWSADSRFLAFMAAGNVKRVAVAGGPVQTIVEALGPIAGGDWGGGDVVLLWSPRNPILRVPAAGGTPVPATALDVSRREDNHLHPHFLPDGRHFLYLARSADPQQNAIYVASLDSEERTRLVNATSQAVYVSPGYLLFHREGTLMAQPFDPDRRQLTGEAVPIADGVQWNRNNGRAAFAASQTRVIAYRTAAAAPPRTMVWVSRSGVEQPLNMPTRAYQQPRLSPDGQRVLVEIDEQENQVWVQDLRRDTLTRVTFEARQNETPIWSPDGKYVAFYSNKNGPLSLFRQPSDRTGGFERLTTPAGEFADAPMSFSPDGQLLAFTRSSPGNRDIWILRLSDKKEQPWLTTPFIEGGAAFSPDGRWLAYVSTEASRPEIYVRPYPGPGEQFQISTQGGTEPVWNRNGRELFFRSGPRLMAVPVTTSPAFSAGKPALLFERDYVSTPLPQTFPHYDVSPDGQRFLLVKEGNAATTQITVVQNWTGELNGAASK